MKTGIAGRKLIESFEGCILGAYDDYDDKILKDGDECRGTLTIGFGHTSVAGSPNVYIGQTITREDADSILSNDLNSVEQQVTNLVKVPLTQNQFDALVSFQFNTGALSRSSVLKYLNAGDYSSSADAFLLYNKGNGQVLPGLVRRRQDEKNLFQSILISTIKETTDNDFLSSILRWLLSLWRNWLLRRPVGNH